MDNGDDCVIICEESDVRRLRAAIPEWFADLGFKMKVEPTVTVLERMEFCQTQPIYDGKRWRMVRGLRSLAKDCTSILDWTSLPAWYRAIGLCGRALACGIPVFGSFYDYLVRIGKDSKVAFHPQYHHMGMRYLSLGMTDTRQGVTTQARLSFAAGFGISPQQQINLEARFDSYGSPAMGKLESNQYGQEDFDCDKWISRSAAALSCWPGWKSRAEASTE
jgi:hypothetical protein